MILALATRYSKAVSFFLLMVMYASIGAPVFANRGGTAPQRYHLSPEAARVIYDPLAQGPSGEKGLLTASIVGNKKRELGELRGPAIEGFGPAAASEARIGGPTQPEMSSFKSVGTDNMVNLFTGDFSYNIPLLDVGGYPVNIFYNGGITPEQEASWVGLGWNINPGSITRNMRGIPDDFSGEEKLVQEQNMKKNVTWGVGLGADFEFVGIDGLNTLVPGLGSRMGYSLNNHLGPAIEYGLTPKISFSLSGKTASEKNQWGASVGANLNVSSRSGLTFSPSFSLSVKDRVEDRIVSGNLSFSTAYNSRNGIKSLQITGQSSVNKVIAASTDAASKVIPEHEKAYKSFGKHSSSISFARPSYTPTMRAIVTNRSFSGTFEAGLGTFLGVKGGVSTDGYISSSYIAKADRVRTNPMVGYLYLEKSGADESTIQDFTRFNDAEITQHTPIISVPQYTYDVFSIQGEGTGGTIRAYRNDNGYVRDNLTKSKDGSGGVGVDLGPASHWGGNLKLVLTPTKIGEWDENNKLRGKLGFTESQGLHERVYFRNPGETSVVAPDQYSEIGDADLVRYKLTGDRSKPNLEPNLQILRNDDVSGEVAITKTIDSRPRNKRSQVISFLTAEEATLIGLDKEIKNYAPDPTQYLTPSNILNVAETFPRIDPAKGKLKTHLSQINVLEGDGKRYVYGLPVYNLDQTDYTFTVKEDCQDCDEVTIEPDELKTDENENPHIKSPLGGKDGYIQTTRTPPYAHSFMLSGLLSPDYVDVQGDGITEDDLGTAVKFNYTNTGILRWRTPLAGNKGHSNPGIVTERKDDKALFTTGKRENWHLQSVESKSMIAFFELDTENREDGNGMNANGGSFDKDDNTLRRLKAIRLYNKADLKKNGLQKAKPVKTVHFGYSYDLSKNTPDNGYGGGKLTLTQIWFTYNGVQRGSKNKYLFSYGNVSSSSDNPAWASNQSDRWGSFKNPLISNPGNIKNRDYPFATQDKTVANANAGAWGLKKILLPSGGQIEVEYESDDYAYVQDRRAAVMQQVVGFGHTPAAYSNKLYSVGGNDILEHDYVFLRVPEACASDAEVAEKYLRGLEQIAFKLKVQMPKGEEFVPVYGKVIASGRYTGASFPAIWIRLEKVDGQSPLARTAIDFLRERLPGQAFPGYDASEEEGIRRVFDLLNGFKTGINAAFRNIHQYFREKGRAQLVNTDQSFARLLLPNGKKLGGGHRVRTVKLRDNWDRMTQQYGSVYGQHYDYTKKERYAGKEQTVSSGVASYEPGVGGEENPFQEIVYVKEKLPLGPGSYGAIEMPVMDAFFPSPLVGYSRVTVTSLGKKQAEPTGKKTRSGVGRQVTEFYTAREYPVSFGYTSFDEYSEKKLHIPATLSFFVSFAFDAKAHSQGFIVVLNDMHGKMKSQASYAENDPAQRLSYTENFYRNTGKNGMADKFNFVHAALGGEVREGNMGIEVEFMTDTREFNMNTKSLDVQLNGEILLPFLPNFVPFIWPTYENSKNIYRSATAMKVVTYHSVPDRVIVIDKSSEVSTENLLYDAETGNVVVTRTNNEYRKPVYQTTYPAYWAYSGMGLAYKNIDAVYTGVNFLDGKITNPGNAPLSAFESGDEIYISNPGSATTDACINTSGNDVRLIWAIDRGKNNSSLTNPAPDFLFIDGKGKLYTRNGVSIRIVRSGKRNMLGTPAGSAVSMESPILTDGGLKRLRLADNSRVVNATAAEYREKWQVDADVIGRYKLVDVLPDETEYMPAGDFEAGPVYVYSDYQYSAANGSGAPGRFRISASSSGWGNWNPGYAQCSATVPASGNFMQIDNSNNATHRIFYRDVSVQPNTSYDLSVLVTSINDPAHNTKVGRFQFVVNGVPVGPVQSPGITQCQWTKAMVVWHSGTNTAAQIVIRNATANLGEGEDMGLDNVSLKKSPVCEKLEVADCNGYLEKSINPYRKGLLGVFRPHRSLVFYGDRREADPTIKTNLPQNGILANFKLYWDFNAQSNLMPDGSNAKWVWNSEVTRLNSKGQELETRDALNIYTSAQYGYDKSLPVAIANNAASHEMFAEGFEDKLFNDYLNSNNLSLCNKQAVDVSLTNNETLITDGSSKHAGKSSIRLDGPFSERVFPVSPLNFSQPDLTFQPKIMYAQPLNNGINITPVFSNAGHMQLQNLLPGGFVLRTYGTPVRICNGPQTQYNGFIESWSVSADIMHYFKVNECKTYTIKTKNIPVNVTGNGGFKIFDLQGNQMPVLIISTSPTTIEGAYVLENTYSVHLAPGIYKVDISKLYAGYQRICPYPQYTGGCNGVVVEYNKQTGNPPVPCCDAECTITKTYNYPSFTVESLSETAYSNLDGNQCVISQLSSSEQMLNPTFSLTPGKKMLLSAWVKESTPAATYTNTQVQLDFGAGNAANVTLTPSGPVIEGWQKVEGTFTVPATGVASATLRLVNNAAQPVYFDDIRMHPYNANMKSYVYDPVNLRLTAELDANNYATFYEYDEEGTLIRTKVETKEGIKTLTESRSAKQKGITNF